MSSPTGRGSEQPHLISLVLQSRNALQQGEAFCSRASSTSTSSAKEATDVLALNAKIQWISNAVIEQLKARPTRISFVLLTKSCTARGYSCKANRGTPHEAREADAGKPSSTSPLSFLHVLRNGTLLAQEIQTLLMRFLNRWVLTLYPPSSMRMHLARRYSLIPLRSQNRRNHIMSQRLTTVPPLQYVMAMTVSRILHERQENRKATRAGGRHCATL